MTNRMCVVLIDIDQDLVQRHCPEYTLDGAYDALSKVLRLYGFTIRQGGFYFREDRFVTSFTGVLMVMDLVRRHPWFRNVVTDIRMLRVEEATDMMPVVKWCQ